MVVQFLQQRGNVWRYRRRVPHDLRASIGKREITIPLGKSEAEALRRYGAVHDEVERRLKRAATMRPHVATPLDLANDARRRVAEELGLDPSWDGFGEPDDDEANVREVAAEQVAAAYPVDDKGKPRRRHPPRYGAHSSVDTWRAGRPTGGDP